MNPGQDQITAQGTPARGAGTRNVRRQRGDAGGTLVGVFIGVVLGLALAAGVAFYLMRSGSAYQPSASAKNSRDVAAAPNGKTDGSGKPRFDFYKILPGGEEPKVQAKASPDKATMDRTLAPQDQRAQADPRAQGGDTRTPAGEMRPPAADARGAGSDARTSQSESRPPEGKAGDRFWLQAGSFSNAGDAENLKARLALAGWEAAVQEADVPDKGVRYRVRLGPYDNTDELNRMKGELARRGFDVAVIKF